MSSEQAGRFLVTVYYGPGLPPERADFTDLAKAEKAFNDAKGAATLWQERSVADGLGWVKLREKQHPSTPSNSSSPEPGSGQ